jgi:hypothetical protein
MQEHTGSFDAGVTVPHWRFCSREGALILGKTPEAPAMNSRLKCHGLTWVVASGFALREPEHKDVSTEG